MRSCLNNARQKKKTFFQWCQSKYGPDSIYQNFNDNIDIYFEISKNVDISIFLVRKSITYRTGNCLLYRPSVHSTPRQCHPELGIFASE